MWPTVNSRAMLVMGVGGYSGGGSLSSVIVIGDSHTTDWAEKSKRERTRFFFYTEIISSSIWFGERYDSEVSPGSLNRFLGRQGLPSLM